MPSSKHIIKQLTELKHLIQLRKHYEDEQVQDWSCPEYEKVMFAIEDEIAILTESIARSYIYVED